MEYSRRRVQHACVCCVCCVCCACCVCCVRVCGLRCDSEQVIRYIHSDRNISEYRHSQYRSMCLRVSLCLKCSFDVNDRTLRWHDGCSTVRPIPILPLAQAEYPDSLPQTAVAMYYSCTLCGHLFEIHHTPPRLLGVYSEGESTVGLRDHLQLQIGSS